MKKTIDFLSDKYNFYSTISFSFLLYICYNIKINYFYPDELSLQWISLLSISIWGFWSAVRIYKTTPKSLYIIFFISLGVLYCPIIPPFKYFYFDKMYVKVIIYTFIVIFLYHFKFFKTFFCKIQEAIKYEQRG